MFHLVDSSIKASLDEDLQLGLLKLKDYKFMEFSFTGWE